MNFNLKEDFLKYQSQTSDHPIGLEISYAKGSYIYDNEDNKYLDFVAGVSASNLGHRNKAIKKANEVARRKLIHIPLREGRTIHHDVKAKDGSGRIILRAASKGTGIIAGGAIRSVCEVLGIQDVVAKSLGSANPHNVLKACVDGLRSQNSPKILSAIRGKKISDIVY